MGKTLRMLCLAMAGAVWAWAGAASGGDADGSARLAACNPHDTAGAVCSRCGRKSFLVRKLYDNRHWDKTRYSTVELAVYSAAAAGPDAQGSCLTYVTEGEAIDLTDNLDGNGERLKLNGVHDIEQTNHFMVPFNAKGWAYLKADLQENGAIRVTGEFGPYNPSYEAEAPNGKDRRMTLSTAGLLMGQEFYVIERSPGDYEPTGYVYVGDDAEADPRVDSSGMTKTEKLPQAVIDGTDPVPDNQPGYVPATVKKGALYLTDCATGEGTTVFVVNSFDMTKVTPTHFGFLEVTASVPWDGRVSFFFDPGDPAEPLPVWNPPFLSIVATDTATGSNYVSSASALSAESPERLDAALHARTDDDTLDAPYNVTWDMSALVPEDFSTTGMVFTVDYLALPEYCVIDLTGGTNGATPAVSYLDAPPEGGWTDLYKTERLPMRLVPPETEGARPFYCALFETTQKQWELVTGGTPSAFPGATRPVERVSWNDIRGDAETCDWPATGAVGEDSFVGILRRKTGLSSLDLPTEAQWEFACRGWRTTDYGYGHVPNGDGMWFKDNSGGETHEAGTRTTNFFGLHDMHGNVAEWCLDRASSTGPERVLRGGGWDDYAPACTSSSRSGHDPATGDGHCGFRLVRHLPLDSESERSPEAEPGGLRVGTVPTQDEEDPTIVSYSCASEAIALSREALRPVPYVERGWDGSAVTESNAVCTNYTVYNGQTRLESGWYVVADNVTNNKRITVSGDVHVILCDRRTLTVPLGITVEGNNSLTVYGQSGDSGRLFAGTDGTTNSNGNYSATCVNSAAGIGSEADAGGNVAIHGGTVVALGVEGAGIGGGYLGAGGSVTVYGGTVTAQGGSKGAGIGGGYDGKGGSVTVYGGTVTAQGGSQGAGIGSGCYDIREGDGGKVAVYGGTVVAQGGHRAAGIGGGYFADGGDVAIHGGTVTALGGSTGNGAAIGGGFYGDDGDLDIEGMRVTDPAGTLATNRVEACRALGQSVTLEECWPHEYEGEKCKWCGAANPVEKVEVQTGAGSTNAVITFTLARDIAGEAPEGAAPHLVVTALDTATGERAVADASALAADDAALAGTAGEHTVTWNLADAFGESFVSTGVVFTVEYRYDAPERWCVIDLSGGKDAAAYPVSYLAEEPSGGFNADPWKTTNLVLRLVEAGTFTMGSPTNELGRYSNETAHEVTLSRPFYIGVFETTQRQWERVTGEKPSYFQNADCYATRPVEQVSYDDIRGSSEGARWPATNAVDAASFLGVLRAKTGLALDLPTEAQWEYACRAGTTTALNSGKNLASTGEDANMGKVGRYWHNGGQDYSRDGDTTGGTAAVGSYAPNDWGLYDMHGNVFEWCLDWFGDYPDGAATDPVGASAETGSDRVLRGGSWSSGAQHCRSAFRGSGDPGYRVAYFGFRVALPVAGEAPVAERTAAGRAGEAVEVQMLKAFAEGDIVVTGWTNEYDGAAHGIAVATNAIEGLELRYGIGPSASDFGLSEPPGFTGVTNATVWVKASAPGYFTATNRATVAITRAELTVRAKDQEYAWNGMAQGEGDTIYATDEAIAAKVEAEGLKGEDRIASVVLDGQATEIGVYTNRIAASQAQIFNGTNNVTGNYEIGYEAGTLTILEAWQTVTFNANGGTCGTATNGYKCGEPYGELPEATRALHTFDGWKTADGARVAATNIVSLDAELTLVADWLAGTTTNGVRWLCATNGDGTVTVTGAVPAAGNMAMPETLDGYAVTAVGTNAFENCTNLTGMALADGVTNIGAWAFSECHGLTNVTFGTNVTAIGNHAFFYCTNLTEVAIPAGVTVLEDEVFSWCMGLTNVTMGGAVTNIGDAAFSMCAALREVELPENLLSIEEMAFAGSGLADVRVPDATTDIGGQAFASSPALTNVWLGTGIESVDETAFFDCTNLATIWVPVEKKGTDLLADAGLPDSCEIRYYGTQVVTFDANGGTCGTATKDCTIGEPYGALPVATWEGYDFLGWFDEAGGGVEVTAADAVSEAAARTLTARWRVGGGYYTVAYNRNGGTGTMAAQVIPRGTKAWLRYNAFRRADHTFMGWAETWNGAVVHADHAAVTDRAPAGGSITFYARWAKTKYTVAFDANGGTGRMAAQGMTYGTSAALRKNAFTRNGWVFIGWARWKNGPVVYADGASVKNLRTDGKTTTLYAKWAKKTYTVAFDANGGKLPTNKRMKPQTFEYGKGKRLQANVFIRSGSFFVGWATTKDGPVAYEDGQWVKNLRTDGGVLTLYAKWVKKAYTVTYDGNGGKGTMHTQLFIYGHSSKLTANKYKRSGWTFAGWGTSKNGPVAYADGALVKNLRTDGGDTKLYAQWKKNAAAKSTAASGTAKKAAGRGMRRGGAASTVETETEDGEEARARVASVTTSDGSDGSAVADGDEETGWAPEGTSGWAWIVLALEATVEVSGVEVVGENLPEETRVLLSQDAQDWAEGETGPARYVWVAWEIGDGREPGRVHEVWVTAE